jgi:hypothetical protein
MRDRSRSEVSRVLLLYVYTNNVAIVDIPNAFVQTVVEDEKDRAFIRIRGPLVDILVSLHLMSMDPT